MTHLKAGHTPSTSDKIKWSYAYIIPRLFVMYKGTTLVSTDK